VFNLSGSEIVVILLLALVVLGPEKLPDALRKAGKTYAELKKMGSSFQSEMRSALDEPMKEMRETADLLRKSAELGASEAEAEETSAPASRAPDRPATSPGAATTPPAPGDGVEAEDEDGTRA
jgi:sec-independent protein translocase protein TatB